MKNEWMYDPMGLET